MIEGVKFSNIDQFLSWYWQLNVNEPVDMAEAMTIFFHTETYDIGAI